MRPRPKPEKWSDSKQILPPQPADHVFQAAPALEVAKQEGPPLAAHELGVALHHAQVCAHVWGQFDLVDDQQVAVADRRAALARDLVALRHVDHVDERVRQLGRERRRQVVAAALNEDDLEPVRAVAAFEFGDGAHVHARVVADGRVRAAARLHADDPRGRQRVLAPPLYT